MQLQIVPNQLRKAVVGIPFHLACCGRGVVGDVLTTSWVSASFKLDLSSFEWVHGQVLVLVEGWGAVLDCSKSNGKGSCWHPLSSCWLWWSWWLAF
jgi:hypothetical protein